MEFVIDLSAKVCVAVGVSTFFNTPSVEMRRQKNDEGIQKTYLTPKILNKIYEKATEVTALMKLVQAGIDAGEAPAAVHIELSKKKWLKIDVFNKQSQVNILTLKDGEIQRGLAFGLNRDEWCALLLKEGEVKKALEKLKTRNGKGAVTMEHQESKHMVTQYKLVYIKPDGTTAPVETWFFTMAEVEHYHQSPKTSWVPRVMERRVDLPKSSAVRNTAMMALILKAMKAAVDLGREEREERRRMCDASDLQDAEKMAHSGNEDRTDEWYDQARDEVTPYRTAGLMLEMLTEMKCENSMMQDIAPPTEEEEVMIRKHVMDRMVLHSIMFEGFEGEQDSLWKLAQFILYKRPRPTTKLTTNPVASEDDLSERDLVPVDKTPKMPWAEPLGGLSGKYPIPYRPPNTCSSPKDSVGETTAQVTKTEDVVGSGHFSWDPKHGHDDAAAEQAKAENAYQRAVRRGSYFWSGPGPAPPSAY